uniref:Uncharacterized protein n=1 Tax=Parascaris univalens TaxID=6257 RepID=A0A915A8P0_PARUN
ISICTTRNADMQELLDALMLTSISHASPNNVQRPHEISFKQIAFFTEKKSLYLEMREDARHRKRSKSFAKQIKASQPSDESDNELVKQIPTVANGSSAPTTYLRYKLTVRLVQNLTSAIFC